MRTNGPENRAGAEIARLNKAGYMRKEQRRNKRTVYIIPKRLFRIWHQMNHSRSTRGLVNYLLGVSATWYQNRDERDEAWEEIVESLREQVEDEEQDRVEDELQYLDYLIESSEGDEQTEWEFDKLRQLGELSIIDTEKELARLDES